jgi:hypothetical protein
MYKIAMKGPACCIDIDRFDFQSQVIDGNIVGVSVDGPKLIFHDAIVVNAIKQYDGMSYGNQKLCLRSVRPIKL